MIAALARTAAGEIAVQMELQRVSRYHVARAVGVSREHLSKVLDGRATPSVDLLERCAGYLRCSWSVRLQPAPAVHALASGDASTGGTA